MNVKNRKIAIVGLGYVGLPLAIEFGKKHKVIGYDIKEDRIKELLSANDSTLEASSEEIQSAIYLNFTSNIEDIKDCNIYIVTVPTPINSEKKPDLTPLINATEMIGGQIDKGDLIIFESIGFPGATEEVCVPILENKSFLKFNKDFFCGYSPERINPGDKNHRITDIKKIPEISRFDPQALAMSLRPGQICKFDRNSATSMNYTYYRICI